MPSKATDEIFSPPAVVAFHISFSRTVQAHLGGRRLDLTCDDDILGSIEYLGASVRMPDRQVAGMKAATQK
jgi:hypothetical protein